MCIFSSLFKQFFPVEIDVFFFSFFIRGSEVNSQNFHILLILTGKNALKWVAWCTFRVEGMLNPMALVSSLYDKWLLKNHNFRQKFYILLILTGRNVLKWVDWCVFRDSGMLNPMVQVSRLEDK